jgi:hypothetical protein
MTHLYLRTHKSKNGVAFIRELVGLQKSSKKEFQLAEFKENKWTLTDSKISISNDIKPSNGDDGCILQFKADNKLVIMTSSNYHKHTSTIPLTCNDTSNSSLCTFLFEPQIKLYKGRRLEYECRCCNCHSDSEVVSAFTAVRFSAEQPYGKAVALLDANSQLIMVWYMLNFNLSL